MAIAKILLDTMLGIGKVGFNLGKNTIKYTAKTGVKGYKALQKAYPKATGAGTFLLGSYVLGSLTLNHVIKPIYDKANNKNKELQNRIDNMRTLEFNKYLNNSYYTFQASTERQRSQNLIDQSNFSGRELLGQEAEYYAS